ncbi:MAG: NVEALA domain-containing protein [Prevotellaceae bacterium]|jgi:hypothetical protein|nr:NVEALA domain-containing protein [Prevotellaceae bacterium]
MQKIYITLVAIAITVVAAFNVVLNSQSTNNLSSVSLENIEALANEEQNTTVACYDAKAEDIKIDLNIPLSQMCSPCMYARFNPCFLTTKTCTSN